MCTKMMFCNCFPVCSYSLHWSTVKIIQISSDEARVTKRRAASPFHNTHRHKARPRTPAIYVVLLYKRIVGPLGSDVPHLTPFGRAMSVPAAEPSNQNQLVDVVSQNMVTAYVSRVKESALNLVKEVR